jgi:hypothetical protein
VAAIGQASAQVPAPAAPHGYWSPATINAPTPEDAYRQGLINRWQYEQMTGPLPQALLGPSVDGQGSDSDGGSRQ